MRKHLNLHAANQLSPDSVLIDQTAAAGWYMIEAIADQQSLGSILTIKAFQRSGQDSHNGKTECAEQSLQLGTSGITRRIIYLHGKCAQLRVSSSLPVDLRIHVQIELSRVTRKFAISRVKRALSKNQNHGLSTGLSPDLKSDGCLGQSPETTTSNDMQLYARYQAHIPVATVSALYPQWRACQLLASDALAHTSGQSSNWMEDTTIMHTDVRLPLVPSYEIKSTYVLLLDKDVCLSDQFEYLMGEAVRSNPDAALWYSDHEHVDDTQQRLHPNFKPAWNPGLLMHGNYVGPMILCTTQLFQMLNGLNAAARSSTMYDFLLRASDLINESQVIRVPHMAYTLPADQYNAPHGFFINDDDLDVLTQFAEKHESRGYQVGNGPYPHTHSISFAQHKPAPFVDIIIPTRDRVDLLKRCVESILDKTNYPNYRITVVDNDSIEIETEQFHSSMSVDNRYRTIAHPGAFNYSRINNSAVAQSTATVVVLLNNDTQIIQANWLDKLVNEALQPDVACVGAKLYYSNGLVQHAGVVVGMNGVAGHVNRFATANEDGYAGALKLSADVSAVTGACLAIRRDVYNQLNGLNEDDLTVAFNDIDLCLKARNAGYRIRFLADVELIHHESVSRGSDNSPEKAARFKAEVNFMKLEHAKWIADDPAWNPNFVRNLQTPTLGACSAGCINRKAA